MTIRFLSGHTVSDHFGFPCDLFHDCDPYIKVKVNSVEVWRGNIHWAQSDPIFGETAYLTVPRRALIDIEIWDSDTGSNSDDLMSSWSKLSIDSLLKTNRLVGGNLRITNQNQLHFTATYM